MRLRMCFAVMILFLMPAHGYLQTKTVTDASIVSGDSVIWSSDTTYVLDGFVFVDSAAALRIEPGTVIKSQPGQGVDASALIVARGGKIYAEGTAQNPIIFTAESDNVSDPNDLPLDTRGLWGGLLILGRARINTATGVGQIEGIPSTESKGAYGGSNDEDNSGVLRYVSIRYGGTDIGSGNEINGLTMGAVGSGTTIEYIEVFNNQDDGYEWFGGTVNTRYIISAFNGDDGFDYDEGFRGKGQFWFLIQDDEAADHGGEHDGGTTPEDGTPFAIPVIYNATYIGAGVNAAADNPHALILRDNAGGKYYNSIFTDFGADAVNIEDLTSGADSRQRLEEGDIRLENNVWYGFGAGSTWAQLAPQTFVSDYIGNEDNVNRIVNPQLRGISRTNDGGLDPRPFSTSPVFSRVGAYPANDNFYSEVDYAGAFGAENWATGWSFISTVGIMGAKADTVLPAGVVNVFDSSIEIGDEVSWTSNNTYVLNGFVFVDSGATLTIQPGTVIKGKPGQGVDASALIVARGGKIYAEGTAQNPIIFTAESDNVSDPNDLPLDTRGLWGGLIVLGRARINTATSVGQIEGIPSTESKGAYGGTNDEDNSGVLRYVSIRYGGTDIGSGNEINGLTMGAVGSGTTIEYIEVFNNQDDGYEWFGGTVNTKYIVSAFNGDDGFDYDEGFRGKGQFWFLIQDDDAADHGGEHDGGTTPEDGTPFAIPVIYNATYIGAGVNAAADNPHALILRDNAGGKYYNSIFTDFGADAVNIEDLTSGADSRQRLEQGDIEFEHNIWHNFGAGSTWEAITPQAFVREYMSAAANDNRITDPLLRGISRTANRRLDPRPTMTGPAYQNPGTVPNDGFYTQTTYLGAFGATNWLDGWTFISYAGIVGQVIGGNQPTPVVIVSNRETVSFNGGGTSISMRFESGDVAGKTVTVTSHGSTPPASHSGETFSDALGYYEVESADLTQFSAKLSFTYQDSQLTGTGIVEDSLIIAYYDESADMWRSLPTTVDKDNNVITATIDHLSLWALADRTDALITGVDGKPLAELPNSFDLFQNYPNPFNPATTIKYNLPKAGLVRVNIYNILGQRVRTLVNGVQPAGGYSMVWDGLSDAGIRVSSGVYIYRMEAPGFAKTRKMMLLK